METIYLAISSFVYFVLLCGKIYAKGRYPMNNNRNNNDKIENVFSPIKTDNSTKQKQNSQEVIQVEDDRERRDGPGGEDGE